MHQIVGRILLATDGSSSADHALDFAAALAVGMKASLIILTVVQSEIDGDLLDLGRVERTGPYEFLERAAAALLTRCRDRAAQLGSTDVECVRADGDPARSILAAADAHGAGLIVLGKRGRGRLEGLLLGSVSQKLVSLAPCPVAIVP